MDLDLGENGVTVRSHLAEMMFSEDFITPVYRVAVNWQLR